MPAQPLVDLDSIDLNRVVVTSAEIRRLCLQRGRFDMLDAIVRFAPGDDTVIGYKDLAESDWWATDHIPGRALFPGVLQIEGAAQMCSYHFLACHPQRAGQFVGFAGVNETRFRGIVTPPARIVYVARPVRVRSTMFTYAAQAFVAGKLVMETEILGVNL